MKSNMRVCAIVVLAISFLVLNADAQLFKSKTDLEIQYGNPERIEMDYDSFCDYACVYLVGTGDVVIIRYKGGICHQYGIVFGGRNITDGEISDILSKNSDGHQWDLVSSGSLRTFKRQDGRAYIFAGENEILIQSDDYFKSTTNYRENHKPKFSIENYKCIMKGSVLYATGEIRNVGNAAGGAKIELVAKDKSGSVLDVAKFFPADTRNINPGAVQAFSRSVHGDKHTLVTCRVVDTTIWNP